MLGCAMLAIGKFARQGQRHVASAAVGLTSLSALMLVALPAQASVPLTRADVEALRNRVEFIPRGRSARVASMRDILSVGDALRTAVSAQADLRFNDGSLARVGERATFRFVPNTRNFRLTNGTVLLLIPPGQGRTNIQTPSAVTGIQGSAVVVRYLPDRDLTVVMALTNNPAGPMTITTGSCAGGDPNACVASEYSLYGGQMALIQNNQVQVVEFDLPLFYQTSSLVEGLELDNPNAESPLGPALESVREETLEALEGQTAFESGVQLPPELLGLDGSQSDGQDWNLSPASAGVSPLTTLRGLLSPNSTLLNFPDISAQQPSSAAAAAAAAAGSQLPGIPPSAIGNRGTTPGVAAGPAPTPGGNTGAAPTTPATPVPATPGGNAGQTPTPGGNTGATPPTPTPPAFVPPALPALVNPAPPEVVNPAPPPIEIPSLPQDPTGDSGLVPGAGGGNGNGPGNSDGPGNAQPPPLTNPDFPAQPPAQPGPFFPDGE